MLPGRRVPCNGRSVCRHGAGPRAAPDAAAAGAPAGGVAVPRLPGGMRCAGVGVTACRPGGGPHALGCCQALCLGEGLRWVVHKTAATSPGGWDTEALSGGGRGAGCGPQEGARPAALHSSRVAVGG